MTASTALLILAGGRSEEHDVSLNSARSLMDALADTPLRPQVAVVTRAGRWLSPAASAVAVRAGRADEGGDPPLVGAQALAAYDVVFPLIHGPYGEDGRLQGLLESAGIPYVGAGVLASALCMDKVASKQVLASIDMPQVRYVALGPDALADLDTCARRIVANLRPPWFVKPANLGSSVGIAKVREPKDLAAAIATARRYDRRLIVEEGVVDAREVEVGMLGNDQVETSVVGEITYQADFYDYATKYTEGRAQMHVPADIPTDVQTKIQQLASRAYAVLDCAGMARIDFFYTPSDGRVYLNEVNTLPGFTPFSMFPSLWQASGRSYRQIIETLVDLAKQRAGAAT